MNSPTSVLKSFDSSKYGSNTPSSRCQLLVSVRDAAEARICLATGVDWIDLKEPLAGSLGMPSLAVAQQVAEALGPYPHRSVALGELAELTDFAPAHRLSQLFPIVKVGLSSLQTDQSWSDKLSRLTESLSAELVPVIYADWQSCLAPSPQQVIAWAVQNQSPYILIDTFHKNGTRLLDHLNLRQLTEIVHQAQAANAKVVLAGSLAIEDLPMLLTLPCAAVAIRSAVCKGPRQGELCPQKIAQWANQLSAGK